MSNQQLIDYQNTVKAANLAKIVTLEQTISTIDSMIVEMNNNITSFTAQKTSTQQQISDIQTQNGLIDDIIAILSA